MLGPNEALIKSGSGYTFAALVGLLDCAAPLMQAEFREPPCELRQPIGGCIRDRPSGASMRKCTNNHESQERQEDKSID